LKGLKIGAGCMALCAANVLAFGLTSPDIAEGQKLGPAQIYKGFGCSGANVSPALAWNDPPAGVRSYAITVYDPDAPTGSGWWHWVVYDIPASVTSLPAAAGVKSPLPPGTKLGRNDFGDRHFGGACPPKGDKPHRYVFTVHALKVERLGVADDASAAMIGFMLNSNRLGAAQITATYGR
jgi:Raf kinase inhibitor-like YbhB/YbcL family protein